ncbi:lytic murein transglycosylase [Rhodobacteraceae bacterium KMS-5]|uniref:Lytic murein transglycosylase n=2 Tax=Tabrizicola oligotrophica TaxID=2710650 RepID=A0A6M0QTT4_9RHOB|nr:lytic murein transglycosylase [Tabrizicola oligotrophica]
MSETIGEAKLTEGSGTQDGLNQWLAVFRERALAAGISSATLDALQGAEYLPQVVYNDRHQNEFTKTIWDYLDKAVSDDRMASGVKALKARADTLARIEATYGVDAEVVAAVWGLESAYGAVRGDVPTLHALATLAYDGRRGAFFEGELIAALKIVQLGDATAETLRGSWAGAMGHTQFMPSSWHAFAVDFTGDGKRDIWSDDPTDALASTAAYLAGKGWIRGAPWGVEITLPPGFDYDLTTERVKKPVAGWQAMGLRLADGGDLPDHGLASVLLPGGHRGAAFLIFQNFHVIESYNTADAYVIAVGHLADRLQGGGPIRAQWPREERALSFDERVSLQRNLTAQGFDTGGIDARMGPKTVAAIKGFQKARGLVPDGFPSLTVLQALQ